MEDDGKRKKNAHGPTLNALKRAKFEAKQKRRRQAQAQSNNGDGDGAHQQNGCWFSKDREEYATLITKADVLKIKQMRINMQAESGATNDVGEERLLQIASWIEPFFDLKRKEQLLSSHCSEEKAERLFIAEGTETVRLLVQRCSGDSSSEDDINGAVASPPPVRMHSILCKRNTFFEAPVRLIDDVEKRISNKQCPFNVIIGSEDAISEIIGFNIARGALACGVVPTYFQTNGCTWLTQTIQQKTHVRLLALDAISDTANLGSIIRTAAALSIDAIVLSDDSCDAYYRQAVRVSMGHVINVPTLRVSDWKKGIDSDDVSQQSESGGLVEFVSWLRVQMKVQCLAAVVDDENDSDTEKDDTQPPLITLESLMHGRNDQSLGSWCCVLGNEGNGIRSEVIAECEKRIKIGMAKGVDSMSVPVAAAILMHGLSLEGDRMKQTS